MKGIKSIIIALFMVVFLMFILTACSNDNKPIVDTVSFAQSSVKSAIVGKWIPDTDIGEGRILCYVFFDDGSLAWVVDSDGDYDRLTYYDGTYSISDDYIRLGNIFYSYELNGNKLTLIRGDENWVYQGRARHQITTFTKQN